MSQEPQSQNEPEFKFRFTGFLSRFTEFPRSPRVTDNMKLYRALRTGTQYIGNWASRDCYPNGTRNPYGGFRDLGPPKR